MEVDEIRKRQQKLGGSIMRNIFNFERETGCVVDKIEIQRSELINVNSRINDDRRRLKYVNIKVTV